MSGLPVRNSAIPALLLVFALLGVIGYLYFRTSQTQSPPLPPIVQKAVETPPSASIEQLLSEMKSNDWRVRAKTAAALGGRQDVQVVSALIETLRDEDSDVVAASGKALLAIGRPAVPALCEATKDDALCLQPESGLTGASKVLASMGKDAVDFVIPLLQSEDFRIRVNAAKILGEIGDARAATPLCSSMNDDVWRVRANACWALEKIGAPAVDALIATLNTAARENAAAALGTIKNARGIPPLQKLLKDDKETPAVRARAAWALGQFQDRGCTETLVSALGVQDNLIQTSVFCALRKISGEDFGNDVKRWRQWHREHP